MTTWRKFDNLEQISPQPTGQINWTKYIRSEYKTEKRLRFPVRKNILSELHSEYAEIRYIFDLCKLELLSSNTPQRIKNTIRHKINFIEEKLYLHKPKIINRIDIRATDNKTVRNCKEQANKILDFNLVDSTAWRVDFSDVFEKLVQYIFKEASKEIGGKLYPNARFHSHSERRYSWELKYIEPDAVYQKENLLIFIDAKYKSNLYNKFSPSKKLKEDHRHDLHQIMAYSSFGKTDHKYGILCYPSNKVEIKTTKFINGINGVENSIIILGIPLKKENIIEVKDVLINELNQLEYIVKNPNNTFNASQRSHSFS
jgi:hypothetical protein